MKIKRIIVKKLFDRFDYDFDFQNEENVSIFIGANASGKSTILNFVSFILEPTFERYQAIELVPFSKFAVELDNGYTLHLDYLNENNFSDRYYINANSDEIEVMSEYNLKQAEYISRLKYYITEGRKNVQCQQSFFLNNLSDSAIDASYSHFSYYILSDYYNKLSDKNSYENFVSLYKAAKLNNSFSERNGLLTCRFEVKGFSEHYYKYALKQGWKYCTELFPFSITALIQAIDLINHNMNINKNINYIATNRTDIIIFSRTVENLNKRIYDLFSVFTKTVSDVTSGNSADKENIRNTEMQLLNRYNLKINLSESYKYIIYSNALNYLEKHQQQKDKVLEIANRAVMTVHNDRSAVLKEYYELKKILVDLEIITDYDEQFDNNYAEKLACYYFAVGIFDTCIDKLNSFLTVNNQRLKENGKKLVFQKRERNGRTIKEELSPYCLKVRYLYGNMPSFNIDRLSSGEKNDLIMFYKLLFEIQSNDLLIIDEPEISQHIELQELFIDEIVNIVRNYNQQQDCSVQAIVATHSPHILNGHYNLLVNKKINSMVDFDNE